MPEDGSRSEQEAKETPRDQEQRQGTPRRFDITAVPGRRASPGRLEVIRVLLIGLALLAVGLFALSEWLALRPLPDSNDALRATSSALLSATPDIPTPVEPGLTPTPLAATTDTATPRPTYTLVPVHTRTPRPTPASTSVTPAPALLPAPDLLVPADGDTPSDSVVFTWQWKGPPLADNQAFDLRIWSAQEEEKGSPKRGAVAPTQDRRAEVVLRYVPAVQEHGPGDYYWTVVVVQLSPTAPPKVVSEWGEARRFVYK